jgi:hypothetical protein
MEEWTRRIWGVAVADLSYPEHNVKVLVLKSMLNADEPQHWILESNVHFDVLGWCVNILIYVSSAPRKRQL